jgi:hypothetical protein
MSPNHPPRHEPLIGEGSKIGFIALMVGSLLDVAAMNLGFDDRGRH